MLDGLNINNVSIIYMFKYISHVTMNNNSEEKVATKVIRAYIRFSKPSWKKDDPNKPKNAFGEKIYISQKVQDMKDNILKFCIEEKMAQEEDDIVWYVDDGVSGGGSYLSRKIKFVIEESKEGDSVVFFELSRIARRMLDVSEIINRLLRGKVRIFCLTPRLELIDDIQSSVYVMAFGIAADIEREMNKARTAKALETRKAKGIILGRKKGSVNSNTICSPYKDVIRKFLIEGRRQTAIADILGIKIATLNAFIKRNKLMPAKERVEIEGKLELQI